MESHSWGDHFGMSKCPLMSQSFHVAFCTYELEKEGLGELLSSHSLYAPLGKLGLVRIYLHRKIIRAW